MSDPDTLHSPPLDPAHDPALDPVHDLPLAPPGDDRPLLTGSWHHEYWPSWLFYIPVVPHIALLMLRHRTLTGFTAVNPGVGGGGGTIGESKLAVTAALANTEPVEIVPGVPSVEPGDPTSPIAASYLIPAAPDPRERSRLLESLLRRRPDRIGTPFILKPDAGQRGYSVRLCRTLDDAARFFDSYTRPAIVQPYHPGPFEIGVFWVRHAHTVDADTPGPSPAGFIFAITLKRFQHLVGDGVRPIERLIREHPRLRAQQRVFLARFADRLQEIPPPGRRLRANIAGNHAQGTLFADGAHLITPALSAAIDAVARRFGDPAGRRGTFDFGRFDLRFSDLSRLQAGSLEPGGIIELNAAMSEATNIYDPDRSWSFAQRTLRAQWSHLMALASARRRAGQPALSPPQLLKELRAFYADRPGSPLSD